MGIPPLSFWIWTCSHFTKKNLMGNAQFKGETLCRWDDAKMTEGHDKERWQISGISWPFAAWKCRGFAKTRLTKHRFIRGNQT
jgi:hypothetical protein